MRRELDTLHKNHSGCCPGHDDFPNDVYRNNRSKRARSRDKKREHKFVRTLVNRILYKEVQYALQ
jgi:hypothetical protein